MRLSIGPQFISKSIVYLSFLLLSTSGFAQSQDLPLNENVGWGTRIKFFLYDWRYLASLSEKYGNDKIKPIQQTILPKANPATAPAVLAAIQWSPSESPPVETANTESAEKYLNQNRAELAAQIREAADTGAKIIVTPEYGVTHTPGNNALTNQETSWTKESLTHFAETVPGPSTDYFGRLAKELGVYIHINFAEGDPSTGKYYNSLVALGPDGKIKAHHRKVNLFENEGSYMSAGKTGTVYDTPYGRIGLMVCADSYHLPLLEAYKAAQVDLLIVSAYWTINNNAMKWMRVISRIVGAPLILSNQTEFPDSGIIQRKGRVQAHLRQSNGIVYGTLPVLNKCSKVF
jgi:predicted amidohydrolase